MISILWQELVGGGGMGMPPDQILYGDDVLPLRFRTQGSQRIDTAKISPLEGVELGCSGLPRWTRGHDACHGGVTIRVANTLAHAGYHMLQGGMIVGSGTQDYTKSGHSIQFYIEGCGLMHTNPILGHSTQLVQGYAAMSNGLQRSMEIHGGIP